MPSPPNDHYALVGKRLGFRLAYIDALHDIREAWGIFRLDDQPVKVRYQSVTIHEVINDTPDTCALTIDAATPPRAGQRLTIRLNANKPRTLFAGPLQTVGLSFELQPHQTVYPCQAIDDTPRANRKLPYGQWTNTSATTVAQWLLTNWAPGYSGAGIQPNLPPVSVNFDASEGMDGCLRQLAKLIGGYFYWDDLVLHLFTDETTEIPDPIDDVHPFLLAPPIAVAIDTSQVRTRVYGKGYAEEVIADVNANDPIIPISNAVMFNPAGGQAVSETQRLRYTGTVPGGAGTVVGPGIGPAAPPTLAIAQGSGVTPGVHDYAVSFVTASGESLVSPRATINVTGTLTPPAAPPAVGPNAGGGNGPNAGAHTYAVTFVNAAGETTPSGTVPFTQPVIDVGTKAIIVVDDPASFGYGELPPGGTVVLWFSYSTNPDKTAIPPANGLNESGISNASNHWTIPQYSPGYGKGFGYYIPMSQDPNVKVVHTWISLNGAPLKILITNGALGVVNQPGSSSWYSSYVSGSISPYAQLTGSNGIVGSALLSAIPLGPAGVTARKIYRTAAGAGQLKLAGTINDNTTATYTDATPDSALGANVPTTNTATAAQVQLAGLAIGAAAVTGRKIYRTPAGASQLKLVATIADNVTTTYLDALLDANLGANAPTGDTSGITQPNGMVIAGSPTLIVAGAGWASPGGGWAIIGNGQQTIRYTAISGNTLTGIPPTGPGAITATVSYNSTVTAAAALLGVTGLLRALIKGAPINL